MATTIATPTLRVEARQYDCTRQIDKAFIIETGIRMPWSIQDMSDRIGIARATGWRATQRLIAQGVAYIKTVRGAWNMKRHVPHLTSKGRRLFKTYRLEQMSPAERRRQIEITAERRLAAITKRAEAKARKAARRQEQQTRDYCDGLNMKSSISGTTYPVNDQSASRPVDNSPAATPPSKEYETPPARQDSWLVAKMRAKLKPKTGLQ